MDGDLFLQPVNSLLKSGRFDEFMSCSVSSGLSGLAGLREFGSHYLYGLHHQLRDELAIGGWVRKRTSLGQQCLPIEKLGEIA